MDVFSHKFKEEVLEIGQVIKGVGGLYEVKFRGNIINCSPRGRLKRDKNQLLIGDFVEVLEQNGEFSIEKIMPRKNKLKRPKVANIDSVVIIISALPKPDFLLIDKMLIYCEIYGITPYIVVNKSDLNIDNLYEKVLFDYSSQVKGIFYASTYTYENIDKIKEAIRENLTCMVGQSAVGKSSLINALIQDSQIEVGGMSKINRGRHTTRHAEIIQGEDQMFLIDTPGFSLLDIDIDHRELKNYYNEYVQKSVDCKFANKCLHINEPDCAVKALVEKGEISNERYERYIEIYKELENKWRKKYV